MKSKRKALNPKSNTAMNQFKTEKLISQPVLGGVQRVKLEEILAYEQPNKYIVKSTEYNDAYNSCFNSWSKLLTRAYK